MTGLIAWLLAKSIGFYPAIRLPTSHRQQRRKAPMTHAATDDREDLQREADFEAALAIVRLIGGLEYAHPHKRRRLEPHVVWLIARNAGYHNLGPEFVQFVRRAVADGKELRRRDDSEAGPKPSASPFNAGQTGHA